MPLSGFNLASDIGNLWVDDDSQLKKRLFFNLFAKQVGDSLQEALATDFQARDELKTAWAEFKNSESEETWQAVLKHSKPLGFFFSFLGHVEELPLELFDDPLDQGGSIYFGECILRRRWSLQEIFNPIRGLLTLGNQKPESSAYSYDSDTGIVTHSDQLQEDYSVALSWIRHLIRDLGVATDDLRTVLAVPSNMTDHARVLFMKLLREAGFKAVVLCSENELAALNTFGDQQTNPVFVNISTLGTQISFSPSGDSEAINFPLDELGEAVDREIEARIQQAIRDEEDACNSVTFKTISEDRLFFWKDAYRSEFWGRLIEATDFYGEFQYPYLLDGSPTFRDVRPILTEDLLRDCLTSKLYQPLKDALVEICAKTNGDIPPVLLSGSGSRRSGLIDWTKKLIAEVCPSSNIDVRNVSEPLDAVVAGALDFGKSISEEKWQSVAGIQESWAQPFSFENRMEDWLAKAEETLNKLS